MSPSYVEAAMKKLKRMIRLISLLSSRKHATLETIRRCCNMSERTTYRYLSQLSEINFPVFYDKQLGAYRLATENYSPLERINTGEIVCILVALRMMSNRLPESYRGDLGDLVLKITAVLPIAYEDILPLIDSHLDSGQIEHDIHASLTTILVNAGLMLNRAITLTVNGNNGKESGVKIKDPVIRFRDRWEVSARDGKDEIGYSLADIARLSVE